VHPLRSVAGPGAGRGAITVRLRTETRRLQRALLAGRHEHVAGPADGTDGARMVRVLLDLSAQAGDADVDGAVEGLPFAVAGHGQQLVARKHLVRVPDESPEELEFHGGERHFR